MILIPGSDCLPPILGSPAARAKVPSNLRNPCTARCGSRHPPVATCRELPAEAGPGRRAWPAAIFISANPRSPGEGAALTSLNLLRLLRALDAWSRQQPNTGISWRENLPEARLRATAG